MVPTLSWLDTDDGCGPGVTSGATGEETDAAAPGHEGVDQFHDASGPGGGLWVAIDEAAPEGVHRFDLHPGLLGEVHVVDRERVVRLDHVHIVDGEPGIIESSSSGRNRRLRP